MEISYILYAQHVCALNHYYTRTRCRCRAVLYALLTFEVAVATAVELYCCIIERQGPTRDTHHTPTKHESTAWNRKLLRAPHCINTPSAAVAVAVVVGAHIYFGAKLLIFDTV
jgi:hypothetical protein